MSHRPTPRKFHPKNLKKYAGDPNNIVARSSWERRFMIYCDLNPTVELWTSEYPIQYYSQVDRRVRRYFIDFIIKLKDGRTLAVEIKPYSQTIPPVINKRKKKETIREELLTYQVNQDKWAAAREWCEKRGFQFIILTERELGIGSKRSTSKQA